MYYKIFFLNSNINMAEKKKNSNSNNINLKFLINAQYLKDLSFENPKAPESLKNIKFSGVFYPLNLVSKIATDQCMAIVI